MTEHDMITRFEELEAGRILGDLDTDEVSEWQELSQKLDASPDLSLEMVAAALESEFIEPEDDELPNRLLEELHRDMAEFIVPETSNEKVIRFDQWRSLLASPAAAWATAAAVAVLAIASHFMGTTSNPVDGGGLVQGPADIAPETARYELISRADDLLQTKFSGTEKYPEMSGNVVWSDSLQEGYMTLTDLPANDPSARQYQLWIVDPTRDEKPVDGGVFNIPAGQQTAIIPIQNPLAVTDPKAFVITLEQPGGVVVSKQEVVVALAATT